MRLWGALWVLFCSVAPSFAPGFHVITWDGGGRIDEYVQKYSMLRAQKTLVVIDGFCASACTIALGFNDYCVTPRARLGFHQVSLSMPLEGGGWEHLRRDEEGTQMLFNVYPPAIKHWVLKRGAMRSNKIRVLEGPELMKRAKPCGRV